MWWKSSFQLSKVVYWIKVMGKLAFWKTFTFHHFCMSRYLWKKNYSNYSKQLGGRSRSKHFLWRLNKIMVCMKHEIIRSLNPFNSFLHVFRKKKGHNILGLMLDPKFKFRLVSNNLRCDRVAILVTQYDELLLFPLLVESYKLLRHNIVVEELINCKAWSA